MTLEQLIKKLDNDSSNIEFKEVMAVISDRYHYQATQFTNGLSSTKVINAAGSNEGSCKIFAFAQMNFQLISYSDQFPEGFGQKSREFVASRFDKAMQHIITAENGISENYWIDLPDEQELEYLDMLASIRDELASRGVYDTQMMKLMKKLRCRANPMHHECASDLIF